MQVSFDANRPVYSQLVKSIEDDILNGVLEEESQIPSIKEFSAATKIGLSTVGRSVDFLVKNGVLYKKRGIGFFVSVGVRQKLIEKRKDAFVENYVIRLLYEAQKLNITKQEIIAMIEGYEGTK